MGGFVLGQENAGPTKEMRTVGEEVGWRKGEEFRPGPVGCTVRATEGEVGDMRLGLRREPRLKVEERGASCGAE